MYLLLISIVMTLVQSFKQYLFIVSFIDTSLFILPECEHLTFILRSKLCNVFSFYAMNN